jgi:hypothetical protein
MTVRVRGIYATALTATLDEVVQASPPIQRRFDESFPFEPAAVQVETTKNRQGVGVHGALDRVADVATTLFDIGIDALVWRDPLPRGGVYAGEVVETLGGGALVDCLPDSDDTAPAHAAEQFPACNTTTGFLPFSKTTRRIETGDLLRVQVTEPNPPWSESRPVLDTTIRVDGALASLVRGGVTETGGPDLADIVPADPPEGWAMDWAPAADDADLDALGVVIERLGERATALDDAFEDADSPEDAAPGAYWRGGATCWVWFGRESRFALDERRRDATATMAGHHRIKAGHERASAAVDFVEDVCEDATGEFPFDAVTRQFGPTEGETVGIGHGKPDGRLIDLGPGEVSDRDAEQITVRREMGGSGTYDALGTQQEPGDVAVTKFKEGRWWYPTIYRSSDGATKGTYVNVCTPVEIFPRDVRYVDLHVDVIKQPDGTVERVDDDELAAAEAAGTVPTELAEKARQVAAAVEKAL